MILQELSSGRREKGQLSEQVSHPGPWDSELTAHSHPVLGNLVAGTEVITSFLAVIRLFNNCFCDWNYPPLGILELLSYTTLFVLCIGNGNNFLESFSVIIID